jgi:Phage integrase, N-terminal SAM-like domain
VSKKTPSQQDKFKSQPDRSISNAHPLRVLPGRVGGRPKPRPRGYGAPVAELAAAPAGAPREHRLTALASEWLLNLRVEGRSPRTLRWYRHHIDAYLGAGGVDDLSSLTAAELRRYVCELQDRGLSDDSVRGAFLSLKCMCNWAAREGYRIDAGLLRVRTPRVSEKELVTYSDQQQDAILAAAPLGWPKLTVRILLGERAAVSSDRVVPPTATAFATGDPFVVHGVVSSWLIREWNEALATA